MVIGTFFLVFIGMQVEIGTAFAEKITPDPASFTANEDGATEVISVTLDEPIIVPPGGDAWVTINISSDDTRVEVSPATLTFLDSEWTEVKSFTITTVGDLILNPDNDVVVTLSAVSDSEYYNGYGTSVAVTLVDDEIDVTPPETTITLSDTESSSATFEFSSDDIAATFECSLDGDDFVACASPYTTPVLTYGEHMLSVRAVDGSSNADLSPATYTWMLFDIDAEPVLVLHFDETTGATAYDSSGSNNDGTVTGDENWVSGYRNNAFDFDGLGNYVTLTRPIEDDFSICAWVQTTSIGNDFNHWQLAPILESEYGGLAYDFGFGVDSAGFLAYGNGGAEDISISTGVNISDDVWHHTCVTRDQSTGTVKVYIDGDLSTENTTSTGTLSANGSAMIGYGSDGATFFDGLIDELYVYDSILSYSDIIELYGDTLPAVESVFPVDGGGRVLVDETIIITFSESMNPDSLIVSTGPCGDECATYDVEWADGNTVVELRKNNGLFERGTTYTIGIEAENVDGISLEDEYEWSFTTQSNSGSSGTSLSARTENLRSQGIVLSIIPSIPPLNRLLRFGMTGDDVRIMQQLLNKKGYTLAATGPGAPGFETPFYGFKTLAMVKKFQLENGLIPDGIVGPLTWKALTQ